MLLFGGVALLLVFRGWQHLPKSFAGLAFRPTWLPILVLTVSGAAYVAAEPLLDVNKLGVGLAILGSYGFLGLYLPLARWQRGFAPVLLLIAVLPFASQLDTYLGFPLRRLAAEWVKTLLGGAAAGISAQTILLFETGATQIDLPCSGIKSLWAGAVLSLALTWLERRRLGLRWLICNLAYIVILFGGNLVRITALVYVGLVLEQQGYQDLIHKPLGLLAFIAASLAFLWLLRCFVPRWDKPLDLAAPPALLRSALFGVVLMFYLGGLNVAYSQHQPPAAPAAFDSWVLPESILAEPVALTPLEDDFFGENGSSFAHKYRFGWQELRGSILVVAADSFRAHHSPSQCLEGAGFELGKKQTFLMAPGFPVRKIELRGFPGSAVFWFQSKGSTTEDFSARVWADLTGRPTRWVLVSILFDAEPEENFVTMSRFLKMIHDSLLATLTRAEAGAGDT